MTKSAERKASISNKLRPLCQKNGAQRTRLTFAGIATKQGEGGGFKLEGADRGEGFSRKVLGSFWHGTSRAQDVGTFHHQTSRGPGRSWLMQKVSGKNGTDGRWHHETPNKEELEFVRHSHDLRFRRCANAPGILCGEVRRMGKSVGHILGNQQAQRMGKCEGVRNAAMR